MRLSFTFSQLERRFKAANRSYGTLVSVFSFVSVMLIGLGLFIFSQNFSPSETNAPEETYAAVAKVQSSNNVGAAFVVRGDQLLTAAHILGNDKSVKLDFSRPGRSLPPIEAAVVFIDKKNDLAVLRPNTDISSITPLELGDSDLIASGEAVTVAGYPNGQFETSRNTVANTSDRILTVRTPFSPGQAGGPVLFAGSEMPLVMAIVFSGRMHNEQQNDQSSNYAMPVNQARKVLQANGFSL